ncbi:phospholipid carrier-dependent glycosyltransferase [Promicromonospora sp. NPDC019610]|uniref:phospholipid carrier-dependent glycosyltransferase n=1 Tax=Promicromonospora sp. NPDC019610 TaxID=3364405 RepID=UPI0037963435
MSRPRTVPGVVWLIVLLHLAVMLAQTAVFPNVRSPDERQHVDLVLQVRQGDAWPWPGPGTAYVTRGVTAGGFVGADSLDGPQHLADRDDVPPRGERPSYRAAGGSATLTAEGADGRQEPVFNQLVQHPPLYYLLGAGVVGLVPGWQDAPLDQVWLLLRWWNALLALPLPLLLFATARRLRLPEPLPVAAALAPLVVPELTHLESAVNNDNLLVVLGACATLLVARVLTGDLGRRTALLLGLVSSLALLTKGFALMFPAWVLLAYVVAAWRHRRAGQLRSAATSLLVVAVVTVPGIAWWVRNVVVHGMLQPHGTHVTPPDLTPVHGWSDGGVTWLGRFAERMVTLFFVQDHAAARAHDASWWAARVALVLVVAGISAALVRRPLPRPDALVLLFPVPALAGIVARGSWEQFAAFGDVGAAQQGRYLYTGLVGLLVVALAGAAVLRAGWRRATPAALLALAVGMHAAYQYDVWCLYWWPADGGPGALGRALGAVGHWYPVPAAVLGAVVAAGVGLALAVTVSVVRTAVAPGPPDDAARSPRADADPVPAA